MPTRRSPTAGSCSSRRSSRRSTRRSRPDRQPGRGRPLARARCVQSFDTPIGRRQLEMPPEVREPIVDGLTASRDHVRTGRDVPVDIYHTTTGEDLFTGLPGGRARSPARPARRRAPTASRGTTRRRSARSASTPPSRTRWSPTWRRPATAPRPRRRSSSACSSHSPDQTTIDARAVSDPLDLNSTVAGATHMRWPTRSCLTGGSRRPGLTHGAQHAQRKPDSGLGNITASPSSPSRNIDWVLLLAQGALAIIGLFVIYSASYTKFSNPYLFVTRQEIFLIGAVICDGHRDVVRLRLVEGPRPVPLRHHDHAAGAGDPASARSAGERRLSFDLGPLKLQPAEFAKFTVLLALAVVPRRGPQRRRLPYPRFVIGLMLVGVPATLIIIQPDLGSASVLIAMAMGVLLVAGARAKYILMITVLSAATVGRRGAHRRGQRLPAATASSCFFHAGLDGSGAARPALPGPQRHASHRHRRDHRQGLAARADHQRQATSRCSGPTSRSRRSASSSASSAAAWSSACTPCCCCGSGASPTCRATCSAPTCAPACSPCCCGRCSRTSP